MTRIITRVPGKLMLMGEYAVSELAHPGIVMAVNRYLTCTLKSHAHYLLEFPGFYPSRIAASSLSSLMAQLKRWPSLILVYDAVTIAKRYLVEEEKELPPFHLIITSDLQTSSGVKMGFGSSAALSVALLASLLRHGAGKWVNRTLLFKLGALTHVMTQPASSCADVAAATYGGIIHYERFSTPWLDDQLQEGVCVHELVERQWPGLYIRSLKGMLPLPLLAGWTGKKASTPAFLQGMKAFKERNPDLFQQFLQDSDEAARAFSRSLAERNSEDLLHCVKAGRRILRFLGSHGNLPIETRPIQKALDAVESLGGAGKTSGAGGGDIIIAWFDREMSLPLSQWQENDITPVPLSLAEEGVRQDLHDEKVNELPAQ